MIFYIDDISKSEHHISKIYTNYRSIIILVTELPITSPKNKFRNTEIFSILQLLSQTLKKWKEFLPGVKWAASTDNFIVASDNTYRPKLSVIDKYSCEGKIQLSLPIPVQANLYLIKVL